MQPAAKRQRIAHGKASRIAELEWERHKSTLTDLYIGQGKTVDEIHKLMSEKYAFLANKQQYQKKFRSWKFTKNISPMDWLALSQQLKRLCLTLDDIDPERGNIDIAFNGQVLAFSKVKKGIYRYDTSLLKRYKWHNNAHINSVGKLQTMLRSIILRCIIRDKENLLGTRMPGNLITLVLWISNIREALNQSTKYSSWSLKKRSDEGLMMCPARGEESVFRSCIQSISYERAYAISPSILTFEDISHQWAVFLKDETCSHIQLHKIWCKTLPVVPKSLKIMGYFAATEILMVTLFFCIVLAPDLALDTLTMSEVVELSSLSPTGPNILCTELLEILFFTAASQGQTTLCEQLIATCINPNAIRPCSTSVLPEWVNSTVLQVSLMVDDISTFKSKQGVIMALLKAGADPNLCGMHGRLQVPHHICCDQSPLSLALRHPSIVLRALLDAGSCVPESLCLTEVFQKIVDPEVISMLLEKGISPEGASVFSRRSWYLCPLQAALDHQNRESALRLLEHVNNGLGFSLSRLPELQVAYTLFNLDACNRFDYDYRTPFTHAVLHHLFDIAEELLKKDADANKSFLDYIWSDLSCWRETRDDLSAMDKYMFSASARPLQAAILKDDLVAARFLLNVGANPNYSRTNELSALATAVWRWNRPIIDLLRKHDAFVSFQDLCFFIIITRKQKQKLTQSHGNKDHIRHLAKRLNVLVKIIREVELDQTDRWMQTLLGKRRCATTAQFTRLLEAW